MSELGKLYRDTARGLYYFSILGNPAIETLLLHDRRVAGIQHGGDDTSPRRVLLDPCYVGGDAEAWDAYQSLVALVCGAAAFRFAVECELDWREWERAE